MNKETKSQSKRILKHLQDGNMLTPRDAAELFDCWRLAARIHELREQGLDIVNVNRPGTYAEYMLFQ
jgi:hypothetical protein